MGDLLERIEAGKNRRCVERPPEQGETGIVKVSAVTWGTFNEDESKTILNEEHLDDRFLIESGDLLMSRANTIELVGASVIVGAIDRTLQLSDKILRLRLKGPFEKWINFFLNSHLGRDQIRSLATGAQQSMRNISQDNIRRIDIPFPPLTEQRRIVEKIETLFAELDKGEESLRQVQTLLARYRQSVLKAAVTGELTAAWRAERAGKLEHGSDLLERLLQTRRERWAGRGKYKEPAAPDTQELSELPRGWVWATVEQLGFVVSGQTPPRVEDHVCPEGDIPWFKVSSMNEPGNEIDLIESRWMFDQAGVTKAKLSLISQGAIVFPKRGGAILTNKKRRLGRRGSIDLNLMAFVPVGIEGYVWSFFKFLDLRSIYDGSNVPQINYKDVAYVSVAVPSSTEEAEVIAARVQHLLEQSKTVESMCQAELARSRALRQSILKDAFSGRLVAQDPSDEPATELLARIRAARNDRKKK